MASNFTEPNWSQVALAKAAGLDMTAPVVKLDNDHLLVFMDLKTRIEYLLDKKDGSMVVSR